MRIRQTSGVALVALTCAVALLPLAAAAVAPQAIYYLPDTYEPDDSAGEASTLPEVTYHNLHDAGDVDWVLFSAEATGQPFVIETEPVTGRDIDLQMQVYSIDTSGAAQELPLLDGSTYSDDTYTNGNWWYTYGSQCFFEAPAPGEYAVKVSPLSAEGNGQIGAYRLTLADGTARRIYGSDRYATSAMVSRTLYPMADLWGSYWDPVDPLGTPRIDGPECIVVASGMNFADALAGVQFVTRNQGVLLLTGSDGLPEAVRDEMVRLLTAYYGGSDPDGYVETGMQVYILGGTAAVGQGVEDEIAGMDGVCRVTRLAGATRYETAAAIAMETSETVGISTTAFVVSGQTPWDALGAGPIAYSANAPVLMTERSDVPDATMEFITSAGITDIVIAGGTGAIDAAAVSELESVASVERVQDSDVPDRYGTASALARWGVENLGMDPWGVVLVSGVSFPDGLSAGTVCARTNGPVLLTRPAELPESVYGYVETYGAPYSACYVIGGPGAVFDGAYRAFQQDLWLYAQTLP